MNASLFSAVMQNSASLVHVNVDVSLFKCEAPIEFRPIGLALTERRKDEAENGKIHEVATKLGRLFNDIVPATPALIQAYGRRASEIMSNEAINPQGTDADGFFKDHIGADARSLWAAATSGPAAISVHLLGCMLANAWSPSEATGLWFQLVQERKQQMNAAMGSGDIVYREVFEASQQEIERSELAKWDASMRAWLRRAERIKRSQHCQFNLIAENIKLPWTSTGTTYQKVIQSWIKSMKTMEDLLNNLPQEATDRALLHAIQSWHLFPDLLVFQGNGTTPVHLKDPLFPASAVLSLGLEYTGKSTHEVNSWSLALSHLRYYGTSVKVTSPRAQPRLDMPKIWLVALGNILRQWQVPNASIEEAVNWFRQLGDLVQQHQRSQSKSLTWLWRISGACRVLLSQDGLERDHDLSLIKYGYRRATHFLDSNPMFTLPFFGLCNPHCMEAMPVRGDINRGIAYLRSACSGINIGNDVRGAINYKNDLTKGVTYHEWATIQHRGRQDQIGNEGRGHVRWIYYDVSEGTDLHHYTIESLEKRKTEIEKLGETCFVLANPSEQPSAIKREEANQHLVWRNPPDVFAEENGWARINAVSRELATFGFQVWLQEGALSISSFQSSLDSARRSVGSISHSRSWLQSLMATKNLLDYMFAILQASAEFSWQRPTRHHPTHRIIATDSHETVAHANDQGWMSYDIMSTNSKPSPKYLISLRVLEIATHIYSQLPAATISPRIVELKLVNARWIPEELRSDMDPGRRSNVLYKSAENWAETMTRAQTFACIAMFESGRFNIDPEQLGEVVALGAEDSLFVSGLLLSDPGLKNEATQLHHLIGNTGQTGLVFLVVPLDPMIREVTYDPFSVQHRAFNGTRQDTFESTSLHLSFTDWKMPIECWENKGEIDQEVFLLESVLSVRQGGKWVGDIDVLSFEKSPYCVFTPAEKCACENTEHSVLGDVVSISSWDELLDPPGLPGIVHAHGNWPARLAVASILSQQGKGHCIAIMDDSPVCWSCFHKAFVSPEAHIPEFIID